MVQEEKEKRLRGVKKSARLISLSLIFSCAVFFGLIAHADAATLVFSPSYGTYSVGNTFTVNVMVASSDQAMNAAEGVINFPTDKLTVVSLSKTGSAFSLWVQEPSFSNAGTTGSINFEGVVLNPGYTGSGVKILTITFRARSAGVANISFASGFSSVLANDGDGTNILKSLGMGQYTLQTSAVEPVAGTLPPKPSLKHYVQNENKDWIYKQSSEDPEPLWINNPNSRLSWTAPSGVTGISTILDDSPSSVPGASSEGLFDNRVIEGQKEGIHYFHIRYVNSKGAGPTLHYKMLVDLTPPHPFAITFPDGNASTNPTPRVAYYTSDDLSGFDRYMMKIDDNDFFRADLQLDRTYRLPKQKLGTHQIVVRAYDRAGNYAEATARLDIQPIAAPVITYYPQHITSPGEDLVLGGTALPDATVEINLVRGGKTIIIFTTRSDRDGNWEGHYTSIIPSGSYEVWADQILDNGAQSLKSQSVYISVNSLFYRFWQWLINLGGIFLIFWILLIIMLMIIYYLWHKYRMLKLRLRKEAHEAEEAFKYSLTRVKEEVSRHEDPVKVEKDLEQMEQKVDKEIKDIDDLGQ